METLDLFRETESVQPQLGQLTLTQMEFVRESPEQRARRRIHAIMDAGRPCIVAFSSGKDSSALANLVLTCAQERVQRAEPSPLVIVTHSDTGVEQPEIHVLATNELHKMQRFAQREGIRLTVLTGQPELNESFACRVIGGRALPAFPDSRADCSTNWKIDVSARLIKRAYAESAALRGAAAPVVMTGVRAGESVARDGRIAHRNETAEGLWTNDDGLLRASPILDWGVDDVWEYLGYCNAGVIDAYSTFDDTMRIYRDSGGSSCVIVADMKSAAHAKPCGVRTGCWACTRVRKDSSMAQMIESDPKRYAYLRPLARLRDFISNTQYDWSRRQYIGRTISADGFIEIAADTYSPTMLRDLLIYTLSAQMLSGVPIISIAQLFAIDARWSQYALWPPFTALKTYFEVMDGNVQEAPELPAFPKTPVPRYGRIQVGQDWWKATGITSTAGLRDVGLEMHQESCGVDMLTLSNGALVMDIEEPEPFAIDEDSAADFLALMAEDYIQTYCRHDYADWTEGFRTYARFGFLTIGPGQSRKTDEILRRSQWRQSQGLHGEVPLEQLLSRMDIVHPHQQALI